MRQNAIPRQDMPRRRRNLFPLFLTGIILGLLGGVPLGWFAHRVYFRYHSAIVLSCRQQHFGQTEAQLQATCGSLY